MNLAILATSLSSMVALFGAVDGDPSILGVGISGVGASQAWVVYQVVRLRAEWDAFKKAP